MIVWNTYARWKHMFLRCERRLQVLKIAPFFLSLLLTTVPCLGADNGMAVLQESKPLVTRTGAWHTWGDHLHLRAGQEKLPLTFEVINGADGRPEASDLKVILNREVLADFSNFGEAASFSVDLTGKLHTGNNSLQVRGFGASGAWLKWRLLIKRPVVESVTPNPIGSAKLVTIRGVYFCDHKERIKVAIGDHSAKIIRSTTGEIVCEPPAHLVSGDQKLTVSVQDVASAPVAISVKAAPRITFIDMLSAPPLHDVTLRGEGFSALASENAVTVGSKAAAIIAATTSSITFKIPDMHFPAWHMPVRVTTNGRIAKERVFIHVDMRAIANEGHPIP